MNFFLFSSYILTIIAIIATPGPNALLMTSHSILYGRRAVLFNAIGSACAAALLISLTLFGFQKIIPKNVIPIVSIFGACYLIFIGVKNLTKNFNTKQPLEKKINKNIFTESFFTGVSNPKDLLFFIILLPQFIDQSMQFNYSAVLLIFGWIFCDLIIMFFYGFAARKIGVNFSNSLINKITKTTGAFIILIGIILMTSSFNAIKGLFL